MRDLDQPTTIIKDSINQIQSKKIQSKTPPYEQRNLLLIVLMLPMATNCKKDDPAPTIVGTWLRTGYTYTLCDQSSDNGTYTCGGGSCTTITFNSNGSVSFGPTSSVGGTYSVTGNTLTLTLSSLGTSVTTSYPFSLTSSTLTISGISTSVRPNTDEPDGVDNCTMSDVYTRQ